MAPWRIVRRTLSVLITALCLVSHLGCVEPATVIEPEAVIQVEPDTICPGDGFATTIALDGGQSTPGGGFSVDDPASMSGQLEYRWVFSGPEYRVVAGSHTEAEISITTAGDVPLSVRLTVTDAAGDSASATATLALSSDGADCS